MASSITHNNDFYASSSRARSVDTIAGARRSRFAPNPCEQPRVVRRTPSALTQIFGWRSAYLLLRDWEVAPPSSNGGAEGRRQTKLTRKRPPKKQQTTAGKASTMLAEAVAAAAPAASHMEPRAAQKAV